MAKQIKSKMGRPPKASKDRKTKLMCIRFTPVEFRQIQSDSKKAGINPTEYLRCCWQKVRGE